MAKKLNKKKFIRFIVLCLVLIAALAVVFLPVLIKLNGEQEVSIGYGQEYVDEGAGLKIGSKQIQAKGSVDTSKIGTYKLKYSFLCETVKRTVNVVDDVVPEITLNGKEKIYITQGKDYTDEGCSAWDEIDGDLTASVEITSELPEKEKGVYTADKEGTFYISYIATDKAGNAVRARREIHVTSGGAMDMDVLEFDLNPFYSDVICQDVGYNEEKFKDLILFGDSFIEKLGEIGLVNTNHMWSRPMTSTDNFYERPIYTYGYLDGETTFFDAMDRDQPKQVLILLNENDTLTWTPEYLNQSCDKAYAQIKSRYPNTTFIICSLMPVEYWYDTPERIAEVGYNRDDRINKMNVYMCELCRKYGFKFMNAAESVKNPETGACYDEYIYQPDGIHLSDEGCQVMLDYIMCHLDY